MYWMGWLGSKQYQKFSFYNFAQTRFIGQIDISKSQDRAHGSLAVAYRSGNVKIAPPEADVQKR